MARRLVWLWLVSLLLLGVSMGTRESHAGEDFAVFLPITSTRMESHGEWIAYVDSIDWNIWLISPDAQRRVQVTDDANPFSLNYFFLKWAPSGQKLAFLRRYMYEESIQVYDLTPGTIQELVVDQSIKGFSWSPDSTEIVYAPQGGATGLHIVELSTGHVDEYLTAPGGELLGWPTWSPDGQYLAFEELAFIEGHGPLVVYDVVNQVYPQPYERLGNISWSPDASALAYDGAFYPPDLGLSISLKIPPFMGQSITLTSGHFDSMPQFSPNGELITFIRANPSLYGGYGPVWLVDPDPNDGTPAYQMTNFDATYPRWSPDGHKLVVQSYCGSPGVCEDDLLILDLDSPVGFVLWESGKWPEWQP